MADKSKKKSVGIVILDINSQNLCHCVNHLNTVQMILQSCTNWGD